MFDIGIFLAAAGITLLEMAEAAAVGIALFAQTRNSAAFLAVAAGVLVVFIPTAVIGNYISLLPLFFVRFISATLLLYFGLRLTRSARRAVRTSLGLSKWKGHHDEAEKGLLATGFSVGAVEAFEAAIVLVALYPNSYSSTLLGLMFGVAVVVFAAAALHSQVRRIKQANMKMLVAALLLTFSSFWYAETLVSITDLLLIPVFIVFLLVVHFVSHYGLHASGILQPERIQDNAAESGRKE
jgi:uncharacterized membrane protein